MRHTSHICLSDSALCKQQITNRFFSCMRYKLFAWTALLGAMLPGVSGCGQEQSWQLVNRMIASDFPNVRHISTDSLASWLADTARSAPFLLDVRKPEEYAISHLSGAVRIDPESADFSSLDSVDHAAPIVVYCSVGYRSSGLAEQLLKAGFSNVLNLQGSIFQWANEGHPVYREGREVKQVHPYDKLWGRLLNRELRAYKATE